MMYSEFTERTGFYPTEDLYRKIEEAYYVFDGNKDEFCRAYKENRSGIAEVTRRMVDQDQIRIREKHEKEIRELETRIRRLEAALEREQEWKPYTDERLYSQKDYDQLKKSGHEMTDEEAKSWIAGEFGFDAGKITINRKMKTYEVNRHSTLRSAGEIDRSPLYDATDWFYVFFEVCGIEYEAYNGTFNRI